MPLPLLPLLPFAPASSLALVFPLLCGGGGISIRTTRSRSRVAGAAVWLAAVMAVRRLSMRLGQRLRSSWGPVGSECV